MKITNYKIVVAKKVEDFEAEVMKFSREGWEVYGTMQFHSRCAEFWQPMVKKFDPHEGKVWVKVLGKPGAWLVPEGEEAASCFCNKLAIKDLDKVV